MRVADEVVADTGEDVARVGVAAVAKVQRHVLGQGVYVVRVGRRREQRADLGDLHGVETRADVERDVLGGGHECDRTQDQEIRTGASSPSGVMGAETNL